MVSGVGGTPPIPPKSTEDVVLGHLANAFKSSYWRFQRRSAGNHDESPFSRQSSSLRKPGAKHWANLDNFSKQATQQ